MRSIRSKSPANSLNINKQGNPIKLSSNASNGIVKVTLNQTPQSNILTK